MPVPQAQQAQFERGHASEEVRTRTAAIYESIDALTGAQRALLVNEALGNVHEMLGHMVEAPQHSAAYATMASGLIAIAGYITQSDRELRGETSTGDSKVTAVLHAFEELVRLSALETMPEEDRETALAITKAAEVRAQKGEDFEAALRDEYQKARAAGFTPSHSAPETVNASADTSTDDDMPGLYL